MFKLARYGIAAAVLVGLVAIAALAGGVGIPFTPADRARIYNIDGDQLKPGEIPAAALASDSVTLAKMANNSVSNAELCTDAVSLAKMGDNSVSNAEICSAAVTGAKIAADSVTVDKMETDYKTGTLSWHCHGTNYSLVITNGVVCIPTGP